MAHAGTHDQGHGHGHGHHEPHSVGYYVKIYGILLVLLVVSIIGPELGIRWLTLVTAFGIAVVKALMVAAYFMHLNIEKKYIWFMLIGMMLMVFLFFIAVAPDVMEKYGSNWQNISAQALIEEHAKPKPDGDGAHPH